MRVTVLTDNISHNELKGEWGLCIYIEFEGNAFLLDSGASDLFIKNAKALNKDMKAVQYAVLSHAHFDHANGMKAFFKENETAKYYLRSGAAENCYFKKWIFHKYIGIRKGTLKEYASRIQYVKDDYTLTSGVYLIPHKTAGLEQFAKRNSMYIHEHKQWRYDDFAHEQSLVFDTPGGLVVFNSCSHGGAANIINEIVATFPDKKMKAFIGGFHIYNRTETEIRDLAKKIKNTGIQEIYTGHCTGKKPFYILQEELGDKIHQFHVGLEMNF